MAFSKIAGLEVTPRREYSSIRRWSSPLSIIPRRIWSSQTLVPAAVSAASRSFTPTVTLIAGPLSRFLAGCPGAGRLGHLPTQLGRPVRGDPKVLVHVLGGPRLAEGVHAEELTLGTDPAVPSEPCGRLDGDAGATRGWQHLVAVALVLLGERVEAGHAHHADGHAVGLELLGGLQAEGDLRARAHQDHVGVPVARVAQHVRPALDRVVRDDVGVQDRQALPRQREAGRRLGLAQREAPRERG